MIGADQPEPISREAHPGRQLAIAITTGEFERACECLARHACFLTPDATAIRGRESIRPVLRQLIAQRTQIEVLEEASLGTAAVELTSQRWRISTRGGGDERFFQETQALLVSSWIEQDWKLVIVAPWGWVVQTAPRSAS
jgi:hypothetical protein